MGRSMISRRSFLKGLIATAAAINVPVELIEQATRAIELLPESPITYKNPVAYIKINDLLVPVGNIEISTPVASYYKKIALSLLEPDYLSSVYFTTNMSLPERWFRSASASELKFAIVSDKLPFEIAGTGYFSSHGYEGMIIPNDEITDEWNYYYTIDGVLMQSAQA